MLTIKKVPTVVSNYQDESSEKTFEGCGRNCLGKCCLSVSKLPLYAFKKDGLNSIENCIVKSSEEQPQLCFLHNLLLGQWEDRMSRGLFRYDVTNCETKIILGQYGFIGQLNEGRHLKKRPTEFRVDQVLQAFDENKFNFTKVGQEEVLFRFEHSIGHKSHFFPNAPPLTTDSGFPSVVAINVSPIEYGHVLLIPRVFDCLPQRIDHESFLLALHLAKEAADPFFRVGYNSLGAFATINHLHFQAYYLAIPFAVEKAPTRRILTEDPQDRGAIVSQLSSYPVRGLVFEGGNTMRDLSDAVASSCICLQNNNIPFNVLVADSGKRIFLFPQAFILGFHCWKSLAAIVAREPCFALEIGNNYTHDLECYAEKQALGEVNHEILETQVNPAVWEISGHIVLKRRKDFEDASERHAWRLLTEVSLSEERFQEVKAYVLEAAGFREADMEENKTNHEEEPPYEQPSPKAVAHLPQDCMVIQ